MTNRDVQRQTMHKLNFDGELAMCQRCGGKPGEPGCGHIVHLTMDAYFDRTKRESERKETMQ